MGAKEGQPRLHAKIQARHDFSFVARLYFSLLYCLDGRGNDCIIAERLNAMVGLQTKTLSVLTWGRPDRQTQVRTYFFYGLF